MPLKLSLCIKVIVPLLLSISSNLCLLSNRPANNKCPSHLNFLLVSKTSTLDVKVILLELGGFICAVILLPISKLVIIQAFEGVVSIKTFIIIFIYTFLHITKKNSLFMSKPAVGFV